MSNTPNDSEFVPAEDSLPLPVEEPQPQTSAIDEAIARAAEVVVLPEPGAHADTEGASVANVAEPPQDVEATVPHDEPAIAVQDGQVFPAGWGAAPAQPAAVEDSEDSAAELELPPPPKLHGNRLFATAVAAVGAAIFAALYAGITYVIMSVTDSARFFTRFVESPLFWGTTVVFTVAYLAFVLLINRGPAWVHAVFSWLIGAFTYASVIGFTLIVVEAWTMSSAEVSELLRQSWLSPYAIVAGLIAREIPVWLGTWIARRGRLVLARNEQALDDYEALILAGSPVH
ncbi:MAG TPA: hypothetical protein VK139_05115 [Microbacteriaceae bacterium]|nr:hypothetical protein [Microbacteriaceae bacterium]